MLEAFDSAVTAYEHFADGNICARIAALYQRRFGSNLASLPFGDDREEFGKLYQAANASLKQRI